MLFGIWAGLCLLVLVCVLVFLVLLGLLLICCFGGFVVLGIIALLVVGLDELWLCFMFNSVGRVLFCVL